MTRTARLVGLFACAAVIVVAAVLLVLRVSEGPHVTTPMACTAAEKKHEPVKKGDDGCLIEHEAGSPVGRSTLIMAVALAIAAGGIGTALRDAGKAPEPERVSAW